MKLKKRVYLLTPLLVLCCVVAAGIFVKTPAKVEAVSYEIHKGTYEAVKLADVIDIEAEMTEAEWETYKNKGAGYEAIAAKYGISPDYTVYAEDAEKYDIYNFDTVLFDYNGYEFNRFFAYNYGEYIYAFKTGGVTDAVKMGLSSFFDYNTTYATSSGTTTKITNYNTDINSGGYPAKHGILKNKLYVPSVVGGGYTSGYNKGLPDFAQFKDGSDTGWQGSMRTGGLLFDPNLKTLSQLNASKYWANYKYGDYGINDEETLEAIRKTYPASFQFVHDTTTGYYTYNSSLNHAQYNENTEEIELYADTLGMTNGTKNQMPLIEGDANRDGTAEMAYWQKEVGSSNYGDQKNGTYFVDYETAGGQWENAGSTVGNSCLFKVHTGTETDRFTPSLRLKAFLEPSNSQNGEEETDPITCAGETANNSITAKNVEYIYINFKVNYVKDSITGSDNKLKFIFTETDVNVYSDTPYQKKDGGNVGAGTYGANGEFNYYTYVYDYSDQLSLDSNSRLATGDIELKIPVSVDELGFDQIGQITIVPFTGDSTLRSAYGDDGFVYFKLTDFGIGYNINGANSSRDNDTSSISSFLPFHKIENSYEGELNGENYGADLSSYMNTWSSIVGSSSSDKTANRAITNEYYNDGLSVVDTNDFGGTAAHFGMSMEVPFYIPADRTTGKDVDGDGEKEDIIFKFTGDDDLWVFVDGYLVLDLGGNHLAQTGSINFTEGTVTYDKAPVTSITLGNPTANLTNLMGSVSDDTEITNLGTAVFSTTNGTGITAADYREGKVVKNITVGNENKTLKEFFEVGEHTVQIFYLERAAGLSNCFISFNLPQVPEGGIVVSNEIALAEDSEIKELPTDLNDDGIEDNEVKVINKNGKLAYTHNGKEIPEGLVAFEYIAKYTVISDYDTDGALPKYKGTYNVYKKGNEEATLVDGLKLEVLEKTKNETGGYATYLVRFYVPVGYTGSILLPDGSEIIGVKEADPYHKDVGITPAFRYDTTNINLTAKYLDIDYKELETSESHSDMTEPTIKGELIGNYINDSYIVGSDPYDISAVNTHFINYIEDDLYDLTIEKIFKDGDPVPVGQSIVFKIVGDDDTNITQDNPLYVSMLIENPYNEDGTEKATNPNIVVISDLVRGNYTVTEISSWSWRYECYNVVVHRDNNTADKGNGTIIGVNPIPESNG